jgi:hypothetical protein
LLKRPSSSHQQFYWANFLHVAKKKKKKKAQPKKKTGDKIELNLPNFEKIK